MAFGALWYGPLFGKVWLRVIGKSPEEIESSATMYLLPLVTSLIGSYVLAIVIAGLGVVVWWQGVVVAAVLWLGIGATGTLTTGTFEDSPCAAWLLFTVYQLIVYGAMGLMFVLWVR